MRTRTVHILFLWALLFAIASGCGGGALDAAPTDVRRAPLTEGDSSSDASGGADADRSRAMSGGEETAPVVSLALSEAFRARVERVQFIPVRASDADREVVRIPDPSRSGSERARSVLRERLGAEGVYDIAFELRETADFSPGSSSTASTEGAVMALTRVVHGDAEDEDESSEPDFGDPVPFPADRTSWQLTSETKGGTYDNGDPVPLPAEPETDGSSKREGEHEDNGDPVPLPADSTAHGVVAIGEAGNEDNGDPVPLPVSPTASESSDADSDEGSGSEEPDRPDPEVFRSERGSYVIFTDVEIATTSQRQVIHEDPDPTE